MRRLDLTDYKVGRKANTRDGGLLPIEVPYHTKDSLLNLMFAREVGLSGAELVRQNILAVKIETCESPDILITEEEWQRIKRAADAVRGLTRDEVELLRRINEAEIVPDPKPNA